jgi:FtsH-binding integral membrane protein
MAEAARLATAATPLNRQSSEGSGGPLKRGTSHYELDYQVGLNPNDIKAQFIQKVYGILGAQLTLTVAIVCAFVYHKPTQEFGLAMMAVPGIGWLMLLIVIPLICAMSYYKDKYPHNFCLLLAFTAVQGVYIGAICGLFAAAGKGDAIVYAGGTTAAIFFLLSAYVRYSGQDFSFLGMFLFVALISNILLGIIAYIFAWSFMIFMYHIFGVLIFSGYIVYDTDQIVNKVSLEECDTGTAIWGALELYMDLINLFIHLLALFGSRD